MRDILIRLFRLSVQIRNPVTRLESSKAQQFQLVYDNIDIFKVFEHYDYDLVRSVFLDYEKVRLRDGLTAFNGLSLTANILHWHLPDDCRVCKNYSSMSVDQEHPQLSNVPEHYLVRRIAAANVRRRRQFAYWKYRKQKLLQRTEDEATSLPTASDRQSEMKMPEADLHTPQVVQPQSVTTATQLPQSLHTLDETMSSISVSEYSPAAQSTSDDFVSFPEPPLCPTDEQFFECPYCFIPCARRTLDSKAWK